MVTLEMLEDLDIFMTLDREQLNQILEISELEKYQVGDRLFREDDEAREMWIVTEGTVQLRFEIPGVKHTSEETTVSSHDNTEPESQVFGWSCFIPPYKMRLSAFCASRRCQVLKINSSRLNELMDANPVIGHTIMRYLVQVVGFRFKQMQDQVVRFMGANIMNSW